MAAAAVPPSVGVSLTTTGFRKMVSMLAHLHLPPSSSTAAAYQVEANQWQDGVASVRAQPRGSVKLHYQRSPLLYADRLPDLRRDGVTGFNQILLEKTL